MVVNRGQLVIGITNQRFWGLQIQESTQKQNPTTIIFNQSWYKPEDSNTHLKKKKRESKDNKFGQFAHKLITKTSHKHIRTFNELSSEDG